MVRDAEGNAISSEVLLREAANLKTRKVKPQVTEAGELLRSWNAVLAMRGLELPPIPGARVEAPGADGVIESSAVLSDNAADNAIDQRSDAELENADATQAAETTKPLHRRKEPSSTMPLLTVRNAMPSSSASRLRRLYSNTTSVSKVSAALQQDIDEPLSANQG